MKKMMLAMRLFLLGTLVVLLSSCLGDSENSQSSTNEFMYITRVDGKKCAAFTLGYLSDEKFEGYQEGDCMQVSYKVVFENNNMKPEYVLIDPANVFPLEEQSIAQRSTQYPSESGNKSNALESFIIRASSGGDHWGDRWLFEYSCQMTEQEKEDNSTSINIYYNPDKQELQNGTAVNEGECILDVVLSRSEIIGDETTSIGTAKKVVNLSHLRSELKAKAIEEPNGGKVLRFRFRYWIPRTSEDSGYYPYITSLENYGMVWAKDEK